MKEINVTGQKRTDLGKKASKTCVRKDLFLATFTASQSRTASQQLWLSQFL